MFWPTYLPISHYSQFLICLPQAPGAGLGKHGEMFNKHRVMSSRLIKIPGPSRLSFISWWSAITRISAA